MENDEVQRSGVLPSPNVWVDDDKLRDLTASLEGSYIVQQELHDEIDRLRELIEAQKEVITEYSERLARAAVDKARHEKASVHWLDKSNAELEKVKAERNAWKVEATYHNDEEAKLRKKLVACEMFWDTTDEWPLALAPGHQADAWDLMCDALRPSEEPDNYVGSAGAEHVTKYDPQWAVQPPTEEEPKRRWGHEGEVLPP